MSGETANTARLRVAHVVASDAFAGLERHALSLAFNLRSIGCDARLVCPASAERLRREATEQSVPVAPVDGNSGWIRGLIDSVREIKPAFLHVHDGRSAVVGSVVSRRWRIPLIRTQHFAKTATMERAGLRRALSLALHRRINRGLAGYIAVSQAAAEGARQRGELGAIPLAVIPPGIRLASASAQADARSWRQTQQAPTVCYVGRLETEKRLEVLLHSMPGVLREVPNCRFVIAGAGADYERLIALASELRINGAIEWPGWVSEPDEVLARSHVYVNTWPWEGFGMAMAEAMSFGLPVIAADSSASREVVVDGETGIRVPPLDSRALAEAIVRVLTDRPLAERMGEAGCRRAEASYGVHATAEQTLAFYESLRAGAR